MMFPLRRFFLRHMMTSKFKRLKLQPWKDEEGTLAHANCVRDSRRLWSWPNTAQKGSELERQEGRSQDREQTFTPPTFLEQC